MGFEAGSTKPRDAYHCCRAGQCGAGLIQARRSKAIQIHAHKEVLIVEGSATLEDLEIGLANGAKVGPAQARRAELSSLCDNAWTERRKQDKTTQTKLPSGSLRCIHVYALNLQPRRSFRKQTQSLHSVQTTTAASRCKTLPNANV